jgi:hypothetical protein
MSPHALRRNLVAFLMALLPVGPAFAHDTWFEAKTPPQPGHQQPGRLLMALGTGNQFPLLEFPMDIRYLPQHGCQQDGKPLALQGIAMAAKSLLLMTQAPGAGPVTCWAQSLPFELDMAADKIAIYFDEIHPPQATRDRWAAMAARGLTWRERYVKHARIEFAGSAAQTAPRPSGMGLDVLMLSGLQAVRSGDALAFQVLRDGQPLPDFAVELRGTSPGPGLWLRTDAQGSVRTTAPAPGRWLLRGTDLRIAADNADQWDSRFITLAFDVQ